MNPFLIPKVVSKACKLIGKPDLTWKLKSIFPVTLFLPHMLRDEFYLFKKVADNNKVFLEYGSGGSTIYLLNRKRKLFSVESNPEFYQYMGSIKILKEALYKNLTYRFIDLGPTNKWGKPTSMDHISGWANYYSSIWDEINPSNDKIDVIFIDGRFRVCCCLYCILKTLEFGWSDTVFVIHDFWRREKYHILLDFLTEVESASNLAVFKLKKKIDIDKIKEKMGVYALATA